LRIIHIESIDKSAGNDIEKKIKELAFSHRVPRSHITYDSDGVGGFLKGYLQNSVPFRNGARPISILRKFQQDYSNLKSQCYYKLAEYVNSQKIYIEARVSAKTKEMIEEELSIIKNGRPMEDGKLTVQRKQQMVEVLGRSPDFSDCMMMRMYFEVAKVKKMGRVLN
jgi:hypothetical protein